MPFQLLYLHGDPESTRIHFAIDKEILLNGIAMQKVLEHREYAVGYAFALFDFPEVFINPTKKRLKVTGDGYFVILDVETQKVVGIVMENENGPQG